MSHNIPIQRVTESRLGTVDFDDIPFGRVFSDHMFVCEYEDGQWKNPRIEPFTHFPIHPASMGLHYGQSIFEGMKASKRHDGKPMLYRPEMHAKRLNASAARMCMPDFPEDLFVEALHKLVGLDADWIPPQKGSALYIRPFMFANDEFIGVKPSSRYKFIIFTGPVGPYYPKPVRLLVEQKYVRAVPGGTGEAKACGNYGGALLPARIAQEKGFDQVMWMDGHEFKYVQEVGTMNIFFVIGDEVVTPATDGAILKGITRDSIMRILRDKGYMVNERRISIDEIVQAHKEGRLKEAFGSGTAAVVAHISEIGYNDEVLTLPPVEEREVSVLAKGTIDDIRAGMIDDPYGWTVPVKSDSTVQV